MAIACYHCGREITGTVKLVVPPKFLESLGEYTKAWHPMCYAEAEAAAAKELGLPTPAAPDLRTAIADFCKHANGVVAEYWKERDYKFSPPPTRRAEYLSDDWCKIISVELRDGKPKDESVYAFVRLTDGVNKTMGVMKAGDIHKPAGWKKPAKWARGTVLDEATWKCAGPHGIAYLK